MPTRRQTILTGTATALALAGCMNTPEEGTNETGDGGTEGGTDGGADDGGQGTTDGTGDGADDGTGGDVTATVATDWDPENESITVTLEDSGDADHVDVTFSGEASAVGRLNEEGDEVVLAYDGFDVTGAAENLGFGREDAQITLPTWSSEVSIRATAVRGDVEATVLDETEVLGDEFVSASVSHLFDEADDRVRVVLDDIGTAHYLDVEFRGDADADGRFNATGDELRLTADGLETLGEAEATTEEGAFDGAENGDTVRVRAIAVRETPDGSRIAAQNIVTDKTGSI